jgi:transposase-like protein
MKRKRRTFTPDIKSKIALEAMKGEKTINEIAQLYEVHPNQVSAWKGEMIANASSAFDRGKRIDEIYTECPFYGSRQMVRQLRREGRHVGRKRVQRHGLASDLPGAEHEQAASRAQGVSLSVA